MNTRDSWLQKVQSSLKTTRDKYKFRPEIEVLEKRLQPTISPTGTAFLAMAGQTFSGQVGSFAFEAGTSSSNYAATILWGDGQQSAGTIDSSGHVTSAHVYNVAGAYAVTLQ